jgi:hypothetical protein
MSKHKKKGGEGQVVDNTSYLNTGTPPIFILIFNLICFVINFVILNYLFNNTIYSTIYILFIILTIASFFTVCAIVLGVINIKEYIKNLKSPNEGDFGNSPDNQSNDNDSTSLARNIALFVLGSGGILQFISTILFVIVLSNRKSADNSFHLTASHHSNLYNYELSYIMNYICMICLAIIIIIPITTNDKASSYDTQTYFMILLFSVGVVCVFSYNVFNYCFSIYSNTMIKGNQLYKG